MTPGIILASGYGSLGERQGTPYPKTLELVGGLPIIVRVVATARLAGLSPVVVVVNTHKGSHLIRKQLERLRVSYAVQENRFGPADAIRAGFNAIPNASHAVVMYGDMPLWQAGTVMRLVRAYQEVPRAVIGMTPVSLEQPHPPEIRRYGRVLRDIHGSIYAIVDQKPASGDVPPLGEVNPSLWVFNKEWFLDHCADIPPYDRGDGGSLERSPQPLVAFAYKRKRPIAETCVSDPNEALGVNTRAELERINAIVSRQENTSITG